MNVYLAVPVYAASSSLTHSIGIINSKLTVRLDVDKFRNCKYLSTKWMSKKRERESERNE